MRLILFLPLLTLAFAACSRFSYREDYIGNFNIDMLSTVRNSGFPDTLETQYAGAVRLYGPDQILIRFAEDDSVTCKLEKDGSFNINNLTTGSTFEGGYSDHDNFHFEAVLTSWNGDVLWYDVTGTR